MSSTAKLGAFMLAALVIIGFLILRIERIPLGGGKRSEARAEFASVAGLDAKSPVRIAGVRVGIVSGVALDGNRAVVTLDLDPSVKLHEGAKAAVRSLGLLGEQYVELDPGPANAPLLPDNPLLVGSNPVGFDKVLGTASDVGSDIKSVTESLRKTLGGDEGTRRMQEIVDNIRDLTASLKAVAAENRSDVHATLANFRDFSQTLKTELPRLAEKLNSLADNLDTVVAENRANISGTMGNVRELSAKLKTTADNLNSIIGKIDRGEGSIGKLVNDSATVDNLNSTLKSVEGGVTMLRDTVGRPARWQLDLDLRAESLPEISDSRSTLNANLWLNDRRFVRLGFVSAPFGKDRTTDETVVYSDNGQPPITYTQRTSKTTNDFTFNAQFGYKLQPTTVVRAGLFESEGGVGVDQSLYKDKVGMSLDAFNFSRKDKDDKRTPHLRFETRFMVTKNLYAFAGYDDPLYQDRRSYLIGGGITWRDEDLKYLLGTAASVGAR